MKGLYISTQRTKASKQTKRSTPQKARTAVRSWTQRFLWGLALGSVGLALPTTAHALPTGENVVAGNATINTAGAHMTITGQNAQANVGITWQSFDVGRGEQVTFNNMNSVLNYVTGPTVSNINGVIDGNAAKVYIVNPNGIIVGDGASINVNSLVLSTRTLNNGTINQSVVDDLGTTFGTAPAEGTVTKEVLNTGTLKVNELLVEGDRVVLKSTDTVQRPTDAYSEGTSITAETPSRALTAADKANYILRGKEVAVGYEVAKTGTISIGDGVNGAQQSHTISNYATGVAADGATKGSTVFTAQQLVNTENGTKPQTGTVNDYMLIHDVYELQAMNTKLDGKYMLANDIDASGTSQWQDGRGVYKGFIPVSGFSSMLEGLQHRVQNLQIKSNQVTGAIGLFKAVSERARVHNLGLTGIRVEGGEYAGGLAGVNEGTITNVYVTGTVKGSNNGTIGGLVGENRSKGTIINSHSMGTVTIEEAKQATQGSVGGLVGTNRGTIRNAYSMSTVLGKIRSGGLVGWNYEGTITNSYTTGTVTGLQEIVGGFVGYNVGTIENSYATGDVSGKKDAGGFVGTNNKNITNAYATGDVKGNVEGNYYLGGFAGGNSHGGTIKNAYATGAVSGTGRRVEGFVGYTYEATSTNSYYEQREGPLSGSPTGTYVLVDATGQASNQPMQLAEFNTQFESAMSQEERKVWRIANTHTPYLNDLIKKVYVTIVPDGVATTDTDNDQNTYVVGELIPLKFSDTININDLMGVDVWYNMKDIEGAWVTEVEDKHRGEPATIQTTLTGNHFPFVKYDNALYRNIMDATLVFYSPGRSIYKGQVQELFPVSQQYDFIINDAETKISIVNKFPSYDKALYGDAITEDPTNLTMTINIDKLPMEHGIPTIQWDTLTVGPVNILSFTGTAGNVINRTDKSVYIDGNITSSQPINLGIYSPLNIYTSPISNIGTKGNIVLSAMQTMPQDFLNPQLIISAEALAAKNGNITTLGTVGGVKVRLDGNQVIFAALQMGQKPKAMEDLSSAYINAKTIVLHETPEDVTYGREDLNLSVGKEVTANTVHNKWGLTYDELPNRTYHGLHLNSDGTGFEEKNNISSYYPIYTVEDLQNMNTNLEANYYLPNDIDASATAQWNDAGTDESIKEGFNPVGEYEGIDSDPYYNTAKVFTGTFDGLEHTVQALNIKRPSMYNVGVWGFIGGPAVIRNLGLVGGSVEGKDSVGSLVGLNLGTITNTYARGAVTGTDFVGGLVGENYNMITNAYATGAVEGGSFVGGLVGKNKGTITNSYATGAVTGRSHVGGLVGINESTITNAYATGAVTGTGYYVGGLVGYGRGTITNAYAMGAVTGLSYVGGLVGINYSMITNAYYGERKDMTKEDQPLKLDGTSTGKFLAYDGTTAISLKEMNKAFKNKLGGAADNWKVYTDGTTPLLKHWLTPLKVTGLMDEMVAQLAESGNSAIQKTYEGASMPVGSWLTYDKPNVETNKVLSWAKNAGTYTNLVDTLYSTQDGYDIQTDESASLPSLKIDKATLHIDVVPDQAATYGDPFNPSGFTYNLRGLVGSDEDKSLMQLDGAPPKIDFASTAWYTAEEDAAKAGHTKDVGNAYSLAISDIRGGEALTNYTPVIGNSINNFAIKPKPITVTVDNQSLVYGSKTVPTYTLTPTGLVYGETYATATKTSTPTFSSDGWIGNTNTGRMTNDVQNGGYVITASGLAFKNYSFEEINQGTLEITPYTGAVTATTAIKNNTAYAYTYGSSEDTAKYYLDYGTTLVNGDTQLISVSAGDFTNTAFKDGGTHTQNVGDSYSLTYNETLTGKNPNYTGTITVNPHAVAITKATVDVKTLVDGGASATYTYGDTSHGTYSAVAGTHKEVNGDSWEDVLSGATYEGGAFKTVTTGENTLELRTKDASTTPYAVTLKLANHNYQLGEATWAKETVKKATVTITPDTVSSITYGAKTAPTVTYKVDGLVYGEKPGDVGLATTGTTATTGLTFDKVTFTSGGIFTAGEVEGTRTNGTFASEAILAEDNANIKTTGQVTEAATQYDVTAVVDASIKPTNYTVRAGTMENALAITKAAAPTIATSFTDATTSGKSYVYGATADPSTYNVTVTGLVNGDTMPTVDTTKFTNNAFVSRAGAVRTQNVGTGYALSYNTSGWDFLKNYNPATVTKATAKVTPADLTLTVQNSSTTYGTAPMYSYTVGTLANGDVVGTTIDPTTGKTLQNTLTDAISYTYTGAPTDGRTTADATEGTANANGYAITGTIPSNALHNYHIKLVNTGKLTIQKAEAPTITTYFEGHMDGGKSYVYGAPADPSTYKVTVTGLVNGDKNRAIADISKFTNNAFVSNVRDAHTQNVGTGYALSYNTSGWDFLKNYNPATVTKATAKVTPADLTLTVQNSSTTYGTAPTYSYTVGTLANGDVVGTTIDPTTDKTLQNTLTDAISYTYTGAPTDGRTTADATEGTSNAGGYAITGTIASNALHNYNITVVNTGKLTIQKAEAPTITTYFDGYADGGKSYVYGAPADPSTYKVTVTGLVNGDKNRAIADISKFTNNAFVSNTRDAHTQNVGTDYALSYDTTGWNFLKNYNLATVTNATAKVTPADLTLTVQNSSTTYGTAPAYSYTVGTLANGDVVGTTLDPKTGKTLGNTLTDAISYTYAGAPTDDRTTADATEGTSNADGYAITGTIPSNALHNYNIIVENNGKLTIKKAEAPTITTYFDGYADGGKSYVYGATADPSTYKVEVEGLVNGDKNRAIADISKFTNNAFVSTARDAHTQNVGTDYALSYDTAGWDFLKNYNPATVTKATAKVTPADLTLTVQNSSTTYGTAPAYSYTVGTLANGDVVGTTIDPTTGNTLQNTLTDAISYTYAGAPTDGRITADATEGTANANGYAITGTIPSNALHNYNIKVVNTGKLTIQKAEAPTITTHFEGHMDGGKSYVYGALADPSTYKVTVTGLVNGDKNRAIADISKFTNNAFVSNARYAHTQNVGTGYELSYDTAGWDFLRNYKAATVSNATASITQAPLTVETTITRPITYGDKENPALYNVNVRGLVNGDTLETMPGVFHNTAYLADGRTADAGMYQLEYYFTDPQVSANYAIRKHFAEVALQKATLPIDVSKPIIIGPGSTVLPLPIEGLTNGDEKKDGLLEPITFNGTIDPSQPGSYTGQLGLNTEDLQQNYNVTYVGGTPTKQGGQVYFPITVVVDPTAPAYHPTNFGTTTGTSYVQLQPSMIGLANEERLLQEALRYVQYVNYSEMFPVNYGYVAHAPFLNRDIHYTPGYWQSVWDGYQGYNPQERYTLTAAEPPVRW